jgi:hypothetical protein
MEKDGGSSSADSRAITSINRPRSSARCSPSVANTRALPHRYSQQTVQMQSNNKHSATAQTTSTANIHSQTVEAYHGVPQSSSAPPTISFSSEFPNTELSLTTSNSTRVIGAGVKKPPHCTSLSAYLALCAATMLGLYRVRVAWLRLGPRIQLALYLEPERKSEQATQLLKHSVERFGRPHQGACDRQTAAVWRTLGWKRGSQHNTFNTQHTTHNTVNASAQLQHNQHSTLSV